MSDRWHELPASDAYPGLTTLTRGGRCVKAVGVGEAVREAIEKKIAEAQKRG